MAVTHEEVVARLDEIGPTVEEHPLECYCKLCEEFCHLVRRRRNLARSIKRAEES